MITTHTMLSLCAASLLACGPTGVVPTSADHPANASARPGLVAESNTLSLDAGPVEAGSVDAGGHDMSGHDMSGHDMSGHDMSGHDMSGHDMSAAPPADLAEVELAAYQRAKPVFEKHCIQCHRTQSKAGKHVAMDVYPFTGHHADEISASIRKALGLTGQKPSMPKDDPGVVKGEELARIVAWLDAFDASHAGQHDAGASGHHHSH